MGTETSPSFSPGFFGGADGRIRPVWRAMWFILFTVLAFWIFAAFRVNPQGWQSRTLQVVAAYLALDAALFLGSWFLLRTVDGRSLRTLGLWFYSGWWKELLLGAATGAGMVVLVIGAMAGTNILRYQGTNGEGARALMSLGQLTVILFLAAAAEELAFRGYAFQRLVDSIGPLWATVTFSAIFGGVHLANPSATAFSTAATVLVGVLLSIAYLKTRALWLPIGLHWGWNFFLGPIFSLPVSGITLPGELLSPDVSGSSWLNGGAYGPEGGALAIGAYLVGIVWLWSARRIGVSPEMQKVLSWK